MNVSDSFLLLTPIVFVEKLNLFKRCEGIL